MEITHDCKQIFCPRCLSENLELHKHDKSCDFLRFLCCNCFYDFSNYDFILNNKIKYRMLLLNTKEASYSTVIRNILRNLAINDVLSYIRYEDLIKIMKSGISEDDNLIHLSRLETNLQHFNSIINNIKPDK